jgi:hypothetical protein
MSAVMRTLGGAADLHDLSVQAHTVTHKIRPNVQFEPNADKLLCGSEMTRSAVVRQFPTFPNFKSTFLAGIRPVS